MKCGTSGGDTVSILHEWCEKKNDLSHNKDDDIIDALCSGHVVFAMFQLLHNYLWNCLSMVFKLNPSGVLTRADFERDSKQALDFPADMHEEDVGMQL